MDRFQKVLMPLSSGMTWVSGDILVIMMFLTVVSVVARSLSLVPVDMKNVCSGRYCKEQRLVCHAVNNK
jgi:hypothetical protein